VQGKPADHPVHAAAIRWTDSESIRRGSLMIVPFLGVDETTLSGTPVTPLSGTGGAPWASERP
jgi:hypothetical protein